MKWPVLIEPNRLVQMILAGCLTLVVWSVLADPPEYNALPEAAHPFDPTQSPKALLRPSPGSLVTEHQIGFDTRAVEIKQYIKTDSALGIDSLQLWQTHYAELSDYLDDALAVGRRDVLRRELVGHARFSDSVKSDANRYELPVKIPDWAKRLGLSKPALSLSGSYTLQVKANSNWTNLQEQEGNANKFPDFSPEQVPNINLTGNIGKFVSMSLVWNQEGFGANQSQDLHVKYAGEKPEDTEDDILQEAEFGLINLALPGTSLTGYSEAASGLLGVKMKLRFGDLDLTLAGGTEQGQTQKQKIGRSAKETVSPLINDRDLDVGRDFFLSWNDRKKWALYPTSPPTEPASLRVFSRIKPTDSRDRPDWKPFYTGTASVRDSLGKVGYTTPIGQSWRELKENVDWFWDKDWGILRLKNGVTGSALAVTWPDAAGSHGTVQGASTFKSLVLLADDNHEDADMRLLQLRNRYYRLGWVAPADRKNMKIRILDRSVLKGDPSVDSSGRAWAYVLGLTLENGVPLWDNNKIFDWDQRAIVFPALEPFRRFGRGELYDTTKSALPLLSSSRFAIEITSRSSSDSIKIGSRDMASVSGSNCVDILEGSEVLTLNGSTKLERGVDYVVQYQTGTITLISEQARNPSADISVDFSCRPFFSLETRTVAGARLEYQLPSLGKQSMLGATFLYRSETVTDPRPQLGREPNQSMLWGTNLRLAGESEWLTDWTSRIPFVHVKSDSKWRLELEGAQSWNKPNTEGYALVDDFENARQDNDLPISQRSWFQASPPGGVPTDGPGNYEDSLDWRHQGTFVWSSNTTVPMKNIYPNYDDGTSAPATTPVLQLKVRPNELSGAGFSWGGMMRAFPTSWRDNSSARYLEVVVHCSDGGELSFDFGQISEDLSIAGEEPDGKLESEDLDANGRPTGIKQNDLGLDGRPDSLEKFTKWVCYGKDCHVDQVIDNKGKAQNDQTHDPVGDDWSGAESNSNDPSPAIDGTEGNNKAVDGGAGTWFDSEDLDRNGSLDVINSFNRYTLVLGGRNQSPYQPLNGNWRLYRIPLDAFTLRKGNGANWSAMPAVRIFYHGLSNKNGSNLFEDRVQIARMSLVGNQWKATGHMAKNDSIKIIDSTATGSWTSTQNVIVPDSSRVTATVVNNFDDASTYHTWGVPVSTDATSGAKLKEQSLRLVYKNLRRDFGVGLGGRSDTGTATRIYDSPRDFTMYRNLSLLLYHEAIKSSGSDGPAPVRVGIQFGSGIVDMAAAPYYEYSFNPVPASCSLGDVNCDESSDARKQSMERNWQDNQIQIALSQLTALKAHRQSAKGSSDSVFREAVGVGIRPGPISRDDSVAIKGDPSVSSVQWMRVWIRPNPGQAGNASRASGEVWVNDLKLEDPYQGVGTALRGSAQVNFSDLLDLSGSTDYQGGDFVPMGQKRPELSSQKSAAHASGTAGFNLERFLPEAWQSRLPVNYTVTAGLDRPWTRPGSDQNLTHDGLAEIAGDVWDGNVRHDSADIANRNSKAYQTLTVTRTLSTSWSRGRDAGSGLGPFLVNTVFARPKLSWTYSEQGVLAPLHRDSTATHSIRLDYDFSPPPPPQLKPFGSATAKWVPSFVQGFTVQPWPTSITSTLGDLDYLDGTHSVLVPDKDSLPQRWTEDRRAGLTHSLNGDWQLFDFLRLSSNIKSARAWDQSQEARLFNPTTALVDAWPLIFDWDTTHVHTSGDPNGAPMPQNFGLLRNENGRQVGFSMDLTPRIIPWMTTSGGYQATGTANREAPIPSVVGVGAQIDTTYRVFWRHDHTDNFRSSFRLDVPSIFRTLQSIGPDSWNKPLESARQSFDRWRWSGIGVEYSVDNRISGVRQTLDYSSVNEGLDGWSLWGWQTGLDDGVGLRSPWDLVTGNRAKSGFGQYHPERLDDPNNYPGKLDGTPSQSGADRTAQINTRSYRLSGSSEVTVPGLLLRMEPSLAYQISWDERWNLPWSVDTTVTWPQISLNTSLPNFAGRVPFLASWLESMTANNSSSWERTQKIYPHEQTSNSDNQTWKFAPLLGIQAKTKGNWSFDDRFNYSITYSKQLNKVPSPSAKNGACPDNQGLPVFLSDTSFFLQRCFDITGSSNDRGYELGDEGTATYRIQTKRGIQILKWFVKLDNDLVVTFRAGWTHSWKHRDETDTSTSTTQQMEDVTTVYGGSNTTYNFTSKLVAQIDAKYQQTARAVKDDPLGEVVTHNISFLASLQYRF